MPRSSAASQAAQISCPATRRLPQRSSPHNAQDRSFKRTRIPSPHAEGCHACAFLCNPAAIAFSNSAEKAALG